MPLKVAILEDDLAQSEMIESWLDPTDYDCHTYSTGHSLLDALNNMSFDILLIDWELPDINGPEVMQAIRHDLHMNTPIIFITSRDSEEDIVSALNAGADDYLVKPIRQFEFLARLKANSRRSQAETENIKSNDYSPYTFNPANQQVLNGDKKIELSSKEFELAYYFFFK